MPKYVDILMTALNFIPQFIYKMAFIHGFFFQALKTKKGGIVKKSIFATPDGPGGKVGVGTCGISGRPMTDYMQAEKRKKK